VTQLCVRMMDRLGQPLDAELSAHLPHCDHCRAVVSAYQALSRARRPDPLDRGGSVAMRELAAIASHPRARPWWWEGVVAVGMSAAISVAGLFALRGNAIVGNVAPPPIVWAIGVLLALLVLAGPIIALAPGRRTLRVASLAFLPLIPLVIGLGGSGLDARASWIKAGISCLTMELALSVAPAVFVLWVLTNSAFQVRRAAVAGMGTGAVGLLVLHLHCPVGSASHLLFFHVLPWVALVAAVVAARSLLPSRSFAP
jgi:hypothetical protein